MTSKNKNECKSHSSIVLTERDGLMSLTSCVNVHVWVFRSPLERR